MASEVATKLLEVGIPGRVDYDEALAWQERLVTRRLAGGPDSLLLVEHPPVYTLGRSADARHLRIAAAGDVPIRRVARGGQVTYHGPGQLIGYPIVALAAQGRDVHRYLRSLEEVVIATLAAFGIAVRRWVAWHGFSLNVGRDLGGFASITPCGICGVEMTSIAHEGGPDDVAQVIPVVLGRFVALFGYDAWDLVTPEAQADRRAAP